MPGPALVGRARAFLSRLGRSWKHDEYARAIAAELDVHLALHSADRMRAGLTPAEAMREARMSLGGVLQTRERCFDAMTFRWMVRWCASAIGRKP